jgi:RNA polymerase II subunit A small phosphatase-like protein
MKNIKNRILLILDLDETLIHATSQKIREDYDFMVYQYFVYKRPYLDEFIRICSENFMLAVWSSASDDYVVEVVERIFPPDIKLEFIWGRSRCTPIISPQIDEYGNYNLDTSSHYDYAKLLKKVKKRGFSLEKTLIVDDTRSKVMNSYGNAIYPKEYKGELDDVELLYLSKYLQTLLNEENMRTVEKRFWRKLYQ